MTKFAHTMYRNKEGELKTRYHTIPESAMSPELLKAYNDLRQMEAKHKAEREAATGLVESLAVALAGALTVTVTDKVLGIDGKFPIVPEGYAPVIGTRFDRLSIGAEPVAVKAMKAKGPKATSAIDFGAPTKAAESLDVPAVLIRKGKKI